MRIKYKALTFEDVLLVPKYSEVLPKEVDLNTKLKLIEYSQVNNKCKIKSQPPKKCNKGFWF